VVVYRLLTAGSVEIEMMEKQISKKKLERLTIHGGDYRVAGRRAGGQLTLNRLRRLLDDDVKNLSRMSVATSLLPIPSSTKREATSTGPPAADDDCETRQSASGKKGSGKRISRAHSAANMSLPQTPATPTTPTTPSRLPKTLGGADGDIAEEENAQDENDYAKDISDQELEMIMNRSLLFPNFGMSQPLSVSKEDSFTEDRAGDACLVPCEGNMYDIARDGGEQSGVLLALR
jgi:hypothetical protein